MDGVCKEWKKAISHFGNNDELSMNDVTIKLFEVTILMQGGLIYGIVQILLVSYHLANTSS